MGLILSLSQKGFAQYSPNCLTTSIDISTGVNHSPYGIYPASPSSIAPTLDHYWQVSSIPTNTTGLVAPKCAERLLTSLVSGGWPNSAGSGWIGLVANPVPSNTAQILPTGNFFWNCPPATPYAPVLAPTVFTRSFFVQSSTTETITINIPTFWGDDYGEIYLDGFGTGVPIYISPAVSTTFGVTVTPVSIPVTPGTHTIDVGLWDVSGIVSAIQIAGSITCPNSVLVSNTCFGISDPNCVVVPPPACDANFTATLTLVTDGTAPDRTIQLMLNNNKTSSTYTVDYGDGGGWVPYNPYPFGHTYASPGTYNVCIKEKTADGVECTTCYELCIGSVTYFKAAIAPNMKKASFIGTEKTLKEGSLSVMPNPAQQNAELKLELINKGEVAVTLIDMTGKRVSEVFSGSLNSGTQKINIKTDNLTSGIYNVEVRIGNQVSFQKLSVIK